MEVDFYVTRETYQSFREITVNKKSHEKCSQSFWCKVVFVSLIINLGMCVGQGEARKSNLKSHCHIDKYGS